MNKINWEELGVLDPPINDEAIEAASLIYKNDTGKNALYRGVPTKPFCRWLNSQ